MQHRGQNQQQKTILTWILCTLFWQQSLELTALGFQLHLEPHKSTTLPAKKGESRGDASPQLLALEGRQ